MYANVIVDISHEKLDKTFQYSIPDELLCDIRPGVCVDIPFGSRTITGYVIEVTDKPEYDRQGQSLLLRDKGRLCGCGGKAHRTCGMDTAQLRLYHESGA